MMAVSFEVGEPRDEELARVAELHCRELGLTLNTLLGVPHLVRVYRAALSAPGVFFRVAREADRVVGFVVAAMNVHVLSRHILSSMTLRDRAASAFALVRRPQAVAVWAQSLWTGRPVTAGGGSGEPTLIAIATDRSCRGQGVGRTLVSEMNRFLAGQGATVVRLDTRRFNRGAREFYRRQGFVEVRRRGFDCVLLREI